MNFTDIFIKRPVLATVVSLLILLFGARAIYDLPVRQFPEIETAVITIITAYPGASAELMQGFVTTPIQKSVGSAEGIDYLAADSSEGLSIVKAYIKLNFNPQEAFTNIQSKVSEVVGELPKESQQPIVSKESEKGSALMYISFNSKDMTPQQITDYVSRVVQPKLETVQGVSQAKILGGSVFAMRIWLDPYKMAAYQVRPDEVIAALQRNNFQTAAGKLKGLYVAMSVQAQTDLHTAEGFGNIVIKSEGGALVRLKNVAKVVLGSENYDSRVTFNGKKAVFIGISATPSANPLTVIANVREVFPSIQRDFPPSLEGKVVYDATKYIRSSIKEVVKTIAEATLIVVVVIFLFLGSVRSVIIPVVTIPLSLIGVCTFMLMLGYSINLLTLLAMVLAIGLVVDDAIVVVENIHRHIEEGMSPVKAALAGAREIAIPVIAMTITLAAVYAPIGFMGGLTGALFKEFAFTLASAVIISGIIALTLSPMMCSKLLTSELGSGRFVRYLDQRFAKLKLFYQRRLHGVLNCRPAMLLVAAVVLLSLYPLYSHTQRETAPEEDTGFFILFAQGPQYATIDYMTKFSEQFNKIIQSFPETEDYFVIDGMEGVNSSLAGMVLKPWGERKGSQQQLQGPLQAQVSQVAGLQTYVVVPPPLPGSGMAAPVEFVVTSTSDHQLIYPVMQRLEEAARNSGKFIFVNSSLQFDKPLTTLQINRNKAAEMGISMEDIGRALSISLGGGYVNRFSLEGRSYKVIPQLDRQHRLTPEQLSQLYVKTALGEMVPLSTIVTIVQTAQPNKLTQFQQLNSATLTGVPRPGVSLGDALSYLETTAQQILPKGMSYDFSGQSRQYMQEGNALTYAFFFSIIIIFLVLAAQYESFRDPIIVLVSVPMSICGALIPLNLGLASINIYTQIGLITLIGLISKHGILMVDFARTLQVQKGLTVRAAIEEAAATRLRPILMTTAAMIVGVVPLLLASGAGANSRYDIGLVITTGMFIGTLFTLFIVPTIYTYLARDRREQTELSGETASAQQAEYTH